MKKILTVSLFAIMAVGAANADIASTSYVDTRTGVMSSLATTDKANLVAAINEVKADISTQSTGNATAINEVKQHISDLDDSLTEAIATAKNEAIAASDSKGSAAQALTDAKAYADAEDKKIEDSIGTVEEGKTVVQMITEASAGAGIALTNALKDYSTTTQMNSAISTAKDEAIAQAATDAAKYIDADELAASQTAQDTILKKYADDAAAAVGTAASGALTTTLADYSTTTQMNSAIATAKSEAATDAQSKADAAEAAAIAASDPKGSAAQALVDAKVFTTQEINALSALAKFPAACAQGVSHCSLTIKDGDLTWEIVQ